MQRTHTVREHYLQKYSIDLSKCLGQYTKFSESKRSGESFCKIVSILWFLMYFVGSVIFIGVLQLGQNLSYSERKSAMQYSQKV